MAEQKKEYFDIRTRNGEKTGEIKERGLVHQDGDIHGTAHVWLYRIRNGELELLLQKRSRDKDSFPGCYDISSAGHLPAGSDFLESAVRELYEELGIAAEERELTLIGVHTACLESEFYGKPFRNYEYSRVYVLYCEKPEEQFQVQEEEIESVCWIKYEELRKRIREDSIVHCIFEDELDLLADYFRKKGIQSVDILQKLV